MANKMKWPKGQSIWNEMVSYWLLLGTSSTKKKPKRRAFFFEMSTLSAKKGEITAKKCRDKNNNRYAPFVKSVPLKSIKQRALWAIVKLMQNNSPGYNSNEWRDYTEMMRFRMPFIYLLRRIYADWHGLFCVSLCERVIVSNHQLVWRVEQKKTHTHKHNTNQMIKK